MIQSNEHLQVKMHGLTGELCDSLGHTTASTTRYFFLFLWLVFVFSFNFFLNREVVRTEVRCEGDGEKSEIVICDKIHSQ